MIGHREALRLAAAWVAVAIAGSALALLIAFRYLVPTDASNTTLAMGAVVAVGCILAAGGAWRRHHSLRVIAYMPVVVSIVAIGLFVFPFLLLGLTGGHPG